MKNGTATQLTGGFIIACLFSTLMVRQLLSQPVTLAIPDTSVASSSLLKLPIRTTDVTGLGIKNEEMIKAKESEKGLQVIEVNSIPGFTGLQNVTNFNIAEEIVNFILSELKK